jgi:signal transduction histidine kinase/DNA-binding response OmpR family regulator/HAMP domain-containing protein
MAVEIEGRALRGEFLRIGKVVNTMVEQLASFASEVTRVAREVGTEGKLGGQADVPGVAGTWKDLTDSVNNMAGNLTAQVRGIAKVVTAVANGALQQKLTVAAKGEIAALSDTINSMIDTLATFADQVTTVAREVGVEGKLGGQAKVPGASGTWKGLTENVNQLAANLTTQVRAIAEVATAVTQGDLTRSITVEARGEVAALKDTTNEMIRNLRDTTRKNTEQDWLKTNLAKFSRMLQGQKDLNTVGRLILSELAPVVTAQHAVFYVLDSSRDTPKLTLLASYGSKGQSAIGSQLDLGEGLVGQCAIEKEKILLADVPRDYITIFSGLGGASPQNILVIPVIFEGQVKGVLELASFERFSPTHEAFLDQLAESIGIVINTIEANTRTEDLLTQSQSLAQELQSRQEELQQTNQELEDKAGLLAHQNQEVERKNQEVEQARKALEEKAEQLALTSKYKSEFLANMSHELRTPLNSLLILSDQLSRNTESNLSAKQVEFAKTIHASGNDLLTLINDILDLSKIESGTVLVDPTDLMLDELRRYVERTFRHVAEAKNVDFFIRLDPKLPKSMFADSKRLQQVLKNLLSNAFKFTHEGHVTLSIESVKSGWSADNDNLNRAPDVISFSVSDTGIGISPEKQQIIFEAFQQADGSTNRKYGGTGLGLAISRELSRLLGGEIRLVSAPRVGSTFTLYLPQIYTSPRPRKPAAPRPGVDTSLYGKTAQVIPELAPERVEERAAAEYRGNGEDRMPADAEDAAHLPAHLINEVGDDRDSISLGDKTLLIVENDLAFARFLLDAAREQGFKGIVTSQGVAALALASQFHPSAISLDLFLPDINGWRVLHRLKNDSATRHIPVAIISTDESREQALESGAYSFVAKPLQSKDVLDSLLASLNRFTQRPEKRLLVASADPEMRDQVVAYLNADDVRIMSVGDRSAAAEIVEREGIDCLVLDAKLSAGHNTSSADEGDSEPTIDSLPILLYGGEKGAMAVNGWGSLARNVVVRDVHSLEGLLDQASLFLHRDPERIPEAHLTVLRRLHDSTHVLKDKRVMIVDDDVRNIFALSSLLEDQGMAVVSHDNGRDAIRHLQAHPDIDVVLMDIMMPELDGVDTIREIRKIPACRDLPIIAVTAKAMKGDREKCMEAGAWDYLSKPVDTELMVGVLRAWLSR